MFGRGPNLVRGEALEDEEPGAVVGRAEGEAKFAKEGGGFLERRPVDGRVLECRGEGRDDG